MEEFDIDLLPAGIDPRKPTVYQTTTELSLNHGLDKFVPAAYPATADYNGTAPPTGS